MNKQKMLILTILVIFSVGMLMGSVTASKTYTFGKYKGTFSNNQISSVKTAIEFDYDKIVTVKTGKNVKYKIPKYKSKNKYKTVDVGKGKYTYGFLLNKYTSKGWKIVKIWSKGAYFDSYFGTMYKHNYAKIKKTVHIKTGTKTIKYPVKMSLSSFHEDGSPIRDGKACLTIWSSAGKISEKEVSI